MTRWSDNLRPRKPSVIGIGAQKGGTTWLNAMLSQHPRLWTTPFKEVHFFDHRFTLENRNWTPWHINRSAKMLLVQYEKKGIEPPQQVLDYLSMMTGGKMFSNGWYKDLFAPAPQGTRPIDITPEYSGLADEGVDFVSKFLPNAQFIYILRHPVDRLISQLKMNMMRKRRKPVGVEAWMAEIEDPVLYARGRYSDYVPRWRARFGPDRLLILPFGDIARQPRDFLRRIEEFLDIPAHNYTGAGNKVFAAQPGLSVPDEVRAEIRNRVEGEFTFMQETFGDAFVQASR
ncbi:MAG: sulfotransferase [Paracoccus sp. (in: a-proteobacteria)]|nr:sulfotransferase [Paracoccus sp. (in: a-proteobacteria)]